MRALLFCSLLCSCAATTPEARYKAALVAKFDGDAKTYYDDLIALAKDAPQSRPGRRARATLRGGGLVSELTLLGVAAAVAMPSYNAMQGNSRQHEVRQGLRSIVLAQAAAKEHVGHYCRTFQACGLGAPPASHYVYFLQPNEVVSAGESEETGTLEERARDMLKTLHITPYANDAGFLVAAVGSADGDPNLDIWTVNERGIIMHVIDVLE